MRKASKVLSAQGATARNWFIHTPVCCPSRNELVTGRYFHNIRNDGPKGGCMHVNQTKTNQQTFAVPLQAAGYRVGIFGKYLNHMPSCQPRGFERYFANNGGKYYGCSFEDNEAAAAGEQFGTYQCAVPEFAGYSTSVIGNKSVAFIRDSAAKQQSDGRPWMAYIAPKAPHVPSQPARWYENATLPGFPLAPRTPNYNYSAKDHHPLIANQPIITAKQAEWTDNLFQNRWRCLLSVDDLIDDVVAEVDALGALGATYFLSTSDHGFNLGQLRLTSCKLNTYDNDIRIPMVIRGPGVAPGSSFWFPASNADVAPTLLGLAGLPTDPSMDGRSVLHQLLDAADPALLPATREHVGGGGDGRAWKSFQLIEYMSLGKVTRNGHDIDEPESNTYRSLRFVNSTLPGLEYQNALYAEFTDLDDWGLEDMKWFEFFNLDEDPWEMTNLYATLSNVTKAALHATVLREWGCRGASCS